MKVGSGENGANKKVPYSQHSVIYKETKKGVFSMRPVSKYSTIIYYFQNQKETTEDRRYFIGTLLEYNLAIKYYFQHQILTFPEKKCRRIIFNDFYKLKASIFITKFWPKFVNIFGLFQSNIMLKCKGHFWNQQFENSLKRPINRF